MERNSVTRDKSWLHIEFISWAMPFSRLVTSFEPNERQEPTRWPTPVESHKSQTPVPEAFRVCTQWPGDLFKYFYISASALGKGRKTLPKVD